MQCGCLKDMYKGGNEESVPVNVVIVAKSHGFFFLVPKKFVNVPCGALLLWRKAMEFFLENVCP